MKNSALFHNDFLKNWLTEDQLSTYRLAKQWLSWLCDNPPLEDQLALVGYYLQQAIGSKANNLLVDKAQSEAIEQQLITRALGRLIELDSGSDCQSSALENAIRLAESQRFAVQAKHLPRRRFLEISRNYLQLDPEVLERLQGATQNSQSDLSM